MYREREREDRPLCGGIEILHVRQRHHLLNCLKMGLIQVKQKLTWIKHHFLFMYVDVYYTKNIH